MTAYFPTVFNQSVLASGDTIDLSGFFDTPNASYSATLQSNGTTTPAILQTFIIWDLSKR
jgi:hypothetical protein